MKTKHILGLLEEYGLRLWPRAHKSRFINSLTVGSVFPPQVPCGSWKASYQFIVELAHATRSAEEISYSRVKASKRLVHCLDHPLSSSCATCPRALFLLQHCPTEVPFFKRPWKRAEASGPQTHNHHQLSYIMWKFLGFTSSSHSSLLTCSFPLSRMK